MASRGARRLIGLASLAHTGHWLAAEGARDVGGIRSTIGRLVNLRGALRGFHTPVLAAGNLSLEVPAFCVWGANTAVGKTLVSAGLARSARRHGLPTFYLKPVQTGFPDDSDASFVAEKATGAIGQGPSMSTMGHHAATAAGRASGGTDLPLTDGGGPTGNFW